MLIRAVIKYFRKRISRIGEELRPRDHEEEEILFELFTKRNYVPHSKTEVFRSFNTEYKEWIFSLPGFCRAYILFYGKKRSSDRRYLTLEKIAANFFTFTYFIIWRYLVVEYIMSFGCTFCQFTKSLMICV
jgi:hypothetical protein